MNDGPTIWALVVGIDKYDSDKVRDLKGAAADAVAAVEWLRKLGVPDAQILLNVSPSDATKPAVDALGIPYGDGRNPSIWSNVAKLLEKSGSRLFVFLCGHGLYEPSTKRLFLTQEAGVDGVYSNMGIDLYSTLFLSLPFPRQFLIMDGCLNLPYSATQRRRIKAAMRDGIDPESFTARPENALLACFGAAQGERVAEIDNRGAFMRRLLPALDPAHPLSVTLDWPSGRLEVDMEKVMEGVSRQVTADAEKLATKVQQRPQATPMGFVRPDRRSPVFAIESAAPVRLEVTVDPVTAAPDLDYVKLTVNKKPWWQYLQPETGATEVQPPVVCQVPQGMGLELECAVREGRPWQAALSSTTVVATEPQAVLITMREAAAVAPDGEIGPVTVPTPTTTPLDNAPPPTGGTPGPVLLDPPTMTTTIISSPYAQQAPPGGHFGMAPGDGGGGGPVSPGALPGAVAEANYKVWLVGRSGHGWPGLTGHYEALEQRLGMDMPWQYPGFTGPTSPWLEAANGVLIQRHEDGPAFRVEPTASVAARRMVRDWAAEIRKVVPRDVTVHTIVEDDTPLAPNLEVVFAASAGELAGHIAGRPTVHIGQRRPVGDPVWRTGDGISLRDLEGKPVRRVDPGPIEVRIDLPWGSWSRIVNAPTVREAVRVRLPKRIGTPPLRVRLFNEPEADGWRLFGTAGRRQTAVIIPGEGAAPVRLQPADATVARWALRQPPGAAPVGQGIVELGTKSRVRFPMAAGWSLAVDWTTRGLQVEPLSKLDTPEWDLLLSAGRLDTLSARDCVTLTQAKWFDAMLGLAGAYVTFAVAKWNYLEEVTENLRRVDPTGVDVDLLAIAAKRADGDALSADSRDKLEALAQERRVPLLRWGVGLALDLLEAAGLDRTPWAADLETIAETLSPISVWSAWTVPSPR